jgi:MoxR-like ATPase
MKHANTTETTTEEARFKQIINRIIASGDIELEIDDSSIRQEITDKVGNLNNEMTSRVEGINKLMSVFAKGMTNAEGSIGQLGDELTAVRARLEKAEAAKVAPPTPVAFDKVELRSEADSVFRTLFTDAMAAKAKDGELAILPPLEKVCPFFVENVQTARIERSIKQRRHLMASGPSGAGKTYPIEQMLRKSGKRYVKVSVADGLSFSDFVARANVRSTKNGTETYYTYGFLPFSMKNGLPLILDEIDQCQPELCSVLNAALETRRLYIPQTGETITASDDWQVFMTCNTLRDTTGNYQGFRLNAALLNRVAFAKADYLAPDDEVKILIRIGLSETVSQKVVGALNAMRAAYNTGKLTQAPSTRLGVRLARVMLGQDDSGRECDSKMPYAEAWQYCLIDGLPDAEATEAAAIIANGL